MSQRILEGIGDDFLIQGLGRPTRANAQQIVLLFTERVGACGDYEIMDLQILSRV